jgi:hypothetical protein
MIKRFIICFFRSLQRSEWVDSDIADGKPAAYDTITFFFRIVIKPLNKVIIFSFN